MRNNPILTGAALVLATTLAAPGVEAQDSVLRACLKTVTDGIRPIAEDDRRERFLGKVHKDTARCRGDDKAVAEGGRPWVDWSNYWAAGDEKSLSVAKDQPGPWDRFANFLGSTFTGAASHIVDRDTRGIDGALLDLEYQRMELIRFNLFDNRTFRAYIEGREVDGKRKPGGLLKVWKEMELPKDHPNYKDLERENDHQLCVGQLIRHRNLTGICNDIRNPAMGSTDQLFARNVQFEATFPDLEKNKLAKDRHGGRLSLLTPDPQVISRKLFTRKQSDPARCDKGKGLETSTAANCDYKKAPFFNVLAAFWIQFMTHDWFSHLKEARNDQSNIRTSLGCLTRKDPDTGKEVALSKGERKALGCRKDDKMDASLYCHRGEPESFTPEGEEDRFCKGGEPESFTPEGEDKLLSRSYKTTRNTVTAWWDASQIYGYDERSRRRVKRDPKDRAKLLMQPPVEKREGAGEALGYLPVFGPRCGDGAASDCDPITLEWKGQEAVAFPDNWSIGLSFYHNVFAREHNQFVDAFRALAGQQPEGDSGLRDPAEPGRVIAYENVSEDELFEAARLVVAAVIAKIHTIEWTTQLLYDEPLFKGMNANWSGLFDDHPLAAAITARLVERLSRSDDPKKANQLYSALNAGPGIVGFGNTDYVPIIGRAIGWDTWDLSDPDDVNGGTNHFGSPFNFPEEFTSVYRLHPLLPDLIEYREWKDDPNKMRNKIAVIDTFRRLATEKMHAKGLANWALSMGRQRLGLLFLQNHPQFLQNLDLRPRLDTKIDVAALDIIRDRERGIPRFNEFRRQIGLKQLTSFKDFIDRRPDVAPKERESQEALVATLRDVYGTHVCDASKFITTAQLNDDGTRINDCLGHEDGTRVDNIEDVDNVVGWLAETTRPHGFAISETQFHIFIINASRRLFSDRFFTSSFRPEFYTHLGIDWVNNNGPTGKRWELGMPNGHKIEVSPMKRVLLRGMPELALELKHVINVFDPWARDRGKYYSLEWRARDDAQKDEAFLDERKQ